MKRCVFSMKKMSSSLTAKEGKLECLSVETISVKSTICEFGLGIIVWCYLRPN
jgi:hypothetical protein